MSPLVSPALALVSISAPSAQLIACTVCFAEAEGDGLRGLWASAGLLAALVYGLLSVFVLVLWRARRRAGASLPPGLADIEANGAAVQRRE